jgi:PTS system beta-glucosides-specific IIC component
MYSFAGPAFTTLAGFIDPNGSNNFYLALGAVALTIVVTFAATCILGIDESKDA